jgi:DNA mismatch repair protein MutH
MSQRMVEGHIAATGTLVTGVQAERLPLNLPRRAAPQSLRELEVRAEALAGHTVSEVAKALGVSVPAESRRAKGFVGALAEAALGADPKAGDGPDFPSLAVELKTIPVSPDMKPRESTFCCAISMESADREEWESSRLWRRLQRVLWVPVVFASGPRANRRRPAIELATGRFGKPRLWRPSPSEVAILRADWEDLMGAVGSGKPPSAYAGLALQLRPKAKSSRVTTLAAGADGPRRALPLGFYLRARFTARILAGATET